MNYNDYNICCLFTSLIIFFLILFKNNNIDFYIILLLSSIFSIIWRGTKIYKGQNKIDINNGNFDITKQLKHPLFILDITFAIFSIILVLYSNQVNKKLIFLTLFVFLIAWSIYFLNIDNSIEISNNIHFLAHIFVIITLFITFYLYIK
tara:strand:- start:5 stop:451 length:447 start_codon:yes stop_codon:yes gene_type:complete